MNHLHIKFDKFKESIAVDDPNLPIIERTRKLSEEEFLEIFNENCKNFSFTNDQLWRNKKKKYDLELFTPNYRRAKPSAFPKFFDEIEGDSYYPVKRKKSLIGGTNKDFNKHLVSADNYLVIPFDNSEIVFCPTYDLLAMSDNRLKGSELIDGKKISDKHFVKVNYTEGFEIPRKEISAIPKHNEKSYEFFISSPCLMVHEDKIDWFRNNL
jgi:hypothetical protein